MLGNRTEVAFECSLGAPLAFHPVALGGQSVAGLCPILYPSARELGLSGIAVRSRNLTESS